MYMCVVIHLINSNAHKKSFYACQVMSIFNQNQVEINRSTWVTRSRLLYTYFTFFVFMYGSIRSYNMSCTARTLVQCFWPCKFYIGIYRHTFQLPIWSTRRQRRLDQVCIRLCIFITTKKKISAGVAVCHVLLIPAYLLIRKRNCSAYRLSTAQIPKRMVAITPPKEKIRMGASPPSRVVPTTSPTFLA